MMLSTARPIGEGRHRKCFVHPDNPTQCIKILFNKESGGEKEVKRELAYYRRLQARNIDWSGLPKYFGAIETDLGVGHVFEFVCDADGSPSKALSHYLEDETDRLSSSQLVALLKALKEYLFRNQIVTMTIKPQNILLRKEATGKGRLTIVDNIGEGTLIPLATLSQFFYEKKMERVWKRFIEKLIESGQSKKLEILISGQNSLDLSAKQV
ncbi:PhoP regulatory network protein YrbL [Leminorella grimontii]|uniref:PhoP regulatory network protein YrbL n=1 Tax=Leminorella grimontii TaxID=82981 RepID=UPI00321FF12E